MTREKKYHLGAVLQIQYFSENYSKHHSSTIVNAYAIVTYRNY